MFGNTKRSSKGGDPHRFAGAAHGPNLSRRGFLRAGLLMGLAATTLPPREALAWSSWTNATSPALKNIGMGDCIHEDLVQIAYARMLRKHAQDGNVKNALLNPWAGQIQSDARYASIAGDTVDAGEGATFADAGDLAARLFRENLAYLRIGSYWNDAAANTLFDFTYSCYYADSVPKFSGNDHYEGAWDVGQHLCETNEQNKTSLLNALDALVQFTMNDRSGFIHGMLTATAGHTSYLKQSEVKQFALQWLGVAYEYARTGVVQGTNDVTEDQATKIFKGFIDIYEQLDENARDMRGSLAASDSEASLKLTRRRLRLRALGMMCHTLEDLWCPAHTCRTYHKGGDIPQNSILAFCNYKLQNGNKPPMLGYHIPFDRYAGSDYSNGTNWREALTRGDSTHKGTETLANTLDDSMACLDDAHTYFSTLGMNESIACITKLFEFIYEGTPWDQGVREWVNTEVMPTYFNNDDGQSYVCDAGRRSLHTPTYVITPIKEMKRAYNKAGLANNHEQILEAARSFDEWQRGTHSFFSGKYNTDKSKYVKSGFESDSIWDDAEGERRLVELVNRLHEGFSGLDSDAQGDLLSRIGLNRCHDMMSVTDVVRGMLQEFNIDLRGSLRSSGDDIMKKLEEVRSFFGSALKTRDATVKPQSLKAMSLRAAGDSPDPQDEESDDDYVTSNMALENIASFEDGSYLIVVRDMDSLETSVMTVPANTPGKDKLESGIANLSITYGLSTEFEEDPDCCYVVTNIDFTDAQEDVYYVTGRVRYVSADSKSIVLDHFGAASSTLAVRKGVTSIPAVGTYVCARYSVGDDSNLEFVGFDELDDPGHIMRVTYPVAQVEGSSVWLLTNGDESDADDGYLNYMQIEYGYADLLTMPQEGQRVTVYYHDVVYGDTTDVDEYGLATSLSAPNLMGMSEQDQDFADSVSTPGYLELGDEYGKLWYGNDLYHVADAIVSQSEDPNDSSSSTKRGRSSQPTPAPSGTANPSTSGTSDSGSPSPAAPSSPSPTTPNRATSNTGTSNLAAQKTSTQTTNTTLPNTGDPLVGTAGLFSAAAAVFFAQAASSRTKDKD